MRKSAQNTSHKRWFNLLIKRMVQSILCCRLWCFFAEVGTSKTSKGAKYPESWSYDDRNSVLLLVLTIQVWNFIWICCHVIRLCSNYSPRIGKGNGLFKLLCQCLADKGCSDSTLLSNSDPTVLLEQSNYRKNNRYPPVWALCLMGAI